jgi:hypothetical protein
MFPPIMSLPSGCGWASARLDVEKPGVEGLPGVELLVVC